jgi:hypothetical protein
MLFAVKLLLVGAAVIAHVITARLVKVFAKVMQYLLTAANRRLGVVQHLF